MSVTQPIIPDYFSVENCAERFRGNADNSVLFARALGMIEGAATFIGVDDSARISMIRNVFAAVDLVQREHRTELVPVETPAEAQAGHWPGTSLVHMDYSSGNALCGDTSSDRRSLLWRHVTCKACVAGAAPKTGELVDQDAEDAAAFDRGFMREHRRVAALLVDGALVHYPEPGVDGDDDDRMACGERFGDAVKTGGFTGVEADVTCPACRASAQLNHTRECRDQLEERPCRFDCKARGES
jgi:hypothetical protein